VMRSFCYSMGVNPIKTGGGIICPPSLVLLVYISLTELDCVPLTLAHFSKMVTLTITNPAAKASELLL